MGIQSLTVLLSSFALQPLPLLLPPLLIWYLLLLLLLLPLVYNLFQTLLLLLSLPVPLTVLLPLPVLIPHPLPLPSPPHSHFYLHQLRHFHSLQNFHQEFRSQQNFNFHCYCLSNSFQCRCLSYSFHFIHILSFPFSKQLSHPIASSSAGGSDSSRTSTSPAKSNQTEHSCSSQCANRSQPMLNKLSRKLHSVCCCAHKHLFHFIKQPKPASKSSSRLSASRLIHHHH